MDAVWMDIEQVSHFKAEHFQRHSLGSLGVCRYLALEIPEVSDADAEMYQAEVHEEAQRDDDGDIPPGRGLRT